MAVEDAICKRNGPRGGGFSNQTPTQYTQHTRDQPTNVDVGCRGDIFSFDEEVEHCCLFVDGNFLKYVFSSIPLLLVSENWF